MITENFKIPSFENEYLLEKRNTKTGEIERYKFHNVVLSDRFVQGLFYGYRNRCGSCYLGDGSGEPSSSDTGLFHELFYVSVDTSSYSTRTDEENNTNEFTYRYVFPASSSYVGTITEVGISFGTSSYYKFLWTHALVTDSEGNPISIEKTAIDEIIVTVKITIRRPDISSNQRWSFVSGLFSNANTFGIQDDSYFLYGGTNRREAYLSQYVLDGLYDQLIDGVREKPCDTDSVSQSGSSVSATYEWGSTNTFRGFVNSIKIGSNRNIFSVLFPNPSIFPIKQLSGISAGIGDGAETDFVPEIPLWVADTEVVYIDGVAQTRGVDYLCDNSANLEKNPAYGLGNFIKRIVSRAGTRSSLWFSEFGTGASSVSGVVSRVSALTPIVYEYDLDRSFETKVNMIKTGQWLIDTSFSGYQRIPSGSYLLFEVSLDGENFDEIYRRNFSSTDSFSDSGFVSIPEIASVRFLRIRLVVPEGTSDTVKNNLFLHLNGATTYSSDNPISFFGYVGEYSIRFTTPPSSNSTITVDLGIDRPYKSSNYIIQYNPVFSF